MAIKHHSESPTIYWQQQVDAWQTSGLSQANFCKTNDLNYHRFGYWVRKFRRQSETAQGKTSSGFVPVTVNPHDDSAGLCLTLPNGICLQGIVNGNLSTVYQLLAHVSAS